jgi:hypothetical protein
MDLTTKAMKFIMADGTNFGGILKKLMDVSAHIITLAGIVSIRNWSGFTIKRIPTTLKPRFSAMLLRLSNRVSPTAI